MQQAQPKSKEVSDIRLHKATTIFGRTTDHIIVDGSTSVRINWDRRMHTVGYRPAVGTYREAEIPFEACLVWHYK